MRPIVTDGIAWSVGPSVGLPYDRDEPCKTAEPIGMPFEMWTRVNPKKHALDGSIHLRHVAKTIEAPICGGDAAFLSNYFDNLLLNSNEATAVIMDVENDVF